MSISCFYESHGVKLAVRSQQTSKTISTAFTKKKNTEGSLLSVSLFMLLCLLPHNYL